MTGEYITEYYGGIFVSISEGGSAESICALCSGLKQTVMKQVY
jgi:hypothetical protein